MTWDVKKVVGTAKVSSACHSASRQAHFAGIPLDTKDPLLLRECPVLWQALQQRPVTLIKERMNVLNVHTSIPFHIKRAESLLCQGLEAIVLRKKGMLQQTQCNTYLRFHPSQKPQEHCQHPRSLLDPTTIDQRRRVHMKSHLET